MRKSNIKQQLPVKIRAANQEDVGFIFNSWLRSYHPSFFARLIDTRIYFENHHKVLEKLAKTAKFIIACSVEDPNQIYGYACSETIQDVNVIHYIYVKHAFRKMGIAKLLLKESGHIEGSVSCTTHMSRAAETPCKQYKIIYHPYLLMDVCHNPTVKESDETIIKMAISEKELQNESDFE